MEFLVGLTGQGYVLVAADVLNVRSIMVLSQEIKKTHMLSAHQALCATGESGEVDRLKERLQAEATLAQYRLGRVWSTKEAACFSRTLIADSLRTRSPFQCNILLAGVDEADPSSTAVSGESALHHACVDKIYKNPVATLYWIDYLGSMQQLPYAAHGYGAFFTWGLLDANYRPDMDVDAAVGLLAKVIKELQTRFIVQLPKLSFVLISGNGARELTLDWNVWTTDGQVSWSFMTTHEQPMQLSPL